MMNRHGIYKLMLFLRPMQSGVILTVRSKHGQFHIIICMTLKTITSHIDSLITRQLMILVEIQLTLIRLIECGYFFYQIVSRQNDATVNAERFLVNTSNIGFTYLMVLIQKAGIKHQIDDLKNKISPFRKLVIVSKHLCRTYRITTYKQQQGVFSCVASAA